ncbi:MAG TPA: late competence development ComFB family protein [Gammaproteobacteria bacterium]
MDFTSIHNYYEHMVIDYLQSEVIPRMPDKSADYFLDVACYALTKLPSRYMRHEIDMAFFLEPKERLAMGDQVKKTVEDAVAFIDKNFNKNNRYSVDP